jgi:hypothetical protein
MKITCVDRDVALKVRAILRRHGISRVSQRGPHIGDDTIQLIVNVAIDPQREPAIRQEIGAIPGASIQ